MPFRAVQFTQCLTAPHMSLCIETYRTVCIAVRFGSICRHPTYPGTRPSSDPLRRSQMVQQRPAQPSKKCVPAQ